jgi:hypothetical protein
MINKTIFKTLSLEEGKEAGPPKSLTTLDEE